MNLVWGGRLTYRFRTTALISGSRSHTGPPPLCSPLDNMYFTCDHTCPWYIIWITSQ